jgi:hypothetical protein
VGPLYPSRPPALSLLCVTASGPSCFLLSLLARFSLPCPFPSPEPARKREKNRAQKGEKNSRRREVIDKQTQRAPAQPSPNPSSSSAAADSPPTRDPYGGPALLRCLGAAAPVLRRGADDARASVRPSLPPPSPSIATVAGYRGGGRSRPAALTGRVGHGRWRAKSLRWFAQAFSSLFRGRYEGDVVVWLVSHVLLISAWCQSGNKHCFGLRISMYMNGFLACIELCEQEHD